MGHYRSKCPKNKSKKDNTKQSEKGETVLMMIEGEEHPHEDIWIMDSAASTHIVNSEVGLFDVKNVCKPVKIGDGKLVYAMKVGRLKVSYANCMGESNKFVLENVQFIPGFWVNLFSLTAAMSKGCSISNEERMIIVSKNLLQLKFNEEIKTKNGFVCGIVLLIKPATNCMLAMMAMADRCRTIDINNLHKKLGHTSKALVQKWPNFMAGSSKICSKLVRAVPSPSCARRTPIRRRRRRERHQARGCSLISAMSRAEVSAACSSGYSPLMM